MHNFLVICVFLCLVAVYALEISVLTVPSAVRNNTKEPVVLDCDYSLRPGDQGLLLKWFLNGDNCVYTWSPPKKAQALGALNNRLDLSFKSSADPLFMYKAIKILNPTTDISGEYKCVVSTYSDEDSASKFMIVFEPERRFTISLGREFDGYINFSCSVCGVYPEAKLQLYQNNDLNYKQRNNLEIVEWIKSKHHSGRYDISIIATAPTMNITPGDVFDCEMRIPGTGYVKKKSQIYYPTIEMRSSASFLSLLHIIIVVAIWIILFI